MSFRPIAYGELTPRAARPRPLKPAQPHQLELHDVATREPITRRTFSPVRRDSFRVGECERAWWSAFSPKESGKLVLAAERYDREGKEPGARRGPLGSKAIEVLRELTRIIDYSTGRLEPAIATLMARCKLARATVVDALQRLRRHGFVSWIRRFAPTGKAGMRGPQVEQATNAYKLSLPERAKRLISRLMPPSPACVERERAERAAQANAWRSSDDSDTADPIARRINQAIAARKTREGEPNASPATGLNPGRGRP